MNYFRMWLREQQESEATYYLQITEMDNLIQRHHYSDDGRAELIAEMGIKAYCRSIGEMWVIESNKKPCLDRYFSVFVSRTSTMKLYVPLVLLNLNLKASSIFFRSHAVCLKVDVAVKSPSPTVNKTNWNFHNHPKRRETKTD